MEIIRFSAPFIDLYKAELYSCIFYASMRAPMICLYALLDTKSACIFTKTQLASGVHVVKTS